MVKDGIFVFLWMITIFWLGFRFYLLMEKLQLIVEVLIKIYGVIQ